jgi:hypothetical protein
VRAELHDQAIGREKHPVRALVRLWVARGPAPLDSGIASSARTQALVEDLLSSGLDATLDTTGDGSLHAWAYHHLGSALATARNMQEVLDPLRASGSVGNVAISVVLDRPVGEVSPSPDAPLQELRSLLNVARPGQILVTNAFYKGIEHSPSLHFRSYAGRPGVFEWLWTNQERLEQLRSASELEPMVLGDTQPTRVLSPSTAPTTPPADIQPGREPIVPGASGSPKKARTLGMAVATVALISLGLGYGIYRAKIHFAPHPTAGKSAPAPPAVTLPPTAKAPLPSVAAPAQKEGNALRRPNSVLDAVEERTVKGQDEETVPQNPIPPKSSRSGAKPTSRSCQISGGEIAQYLNMAENNRSNGEYQQAIRQYGKVLECDPSNRQAREGLARARVNESLASH